MDNPAVDTFIGSGARFHGEFELEGSLRIDGFFTGKIESGNTVIVGVTGEVRTNIHARRVIVAGRVEGNIFGTESVHLLSDSVILGDIITKNLIMDSGVVFEGRAKTIMENGTGNPAEP